MRVFAYIVASLPFPVLYLLSDVLASLASLFYRRKLVTANLTSCFPEKSVREIHAIRRKFYRNLTDVTLEAFKTLGMDRTAFTNRVKLIRNESLTEIEHNQAPFLLYASHQCNWEWLGTAIGIQLAPLDPIYKEIRNSGSNRLMAEIRSRFGNRPIPAAQAGRVYRYQKEFRGGGIIADQSPTRKNKGKVWVNFLGRETPFYQGIFVLPYLTQLPVYYVSVVRLARGKYEVELHKMADPPYQKGDHQILDKYIRFSESAVRAKPSDWLWSHNRWKYRRSKNEELINFQ